MTDRIHALSIAAEQAARAMRRSIHRHPELGWSEIRTTSLIRDELQGHPNLKILCGPELLRDVRKLGVPDDQVLVEAASRATASGVAAEDVALFGGGQTGLVALDERGDAGPSIAIRADLDALPLRESEAAGHQPNDEGFRSEADGIMHACAHDAHVAVAVAAAKMIAGLDERPPARIKWLFQPAEEGTRGADAFVRAGLLDDVDYVLTFHFLTNVGLECGEASPVIASMLPTRKLRVEFQGHPSQFASSPQRGRNALTVGAAVTLLAHAIPRAPGSRSMINVGRLEAGTAPNIVPAAGRMGAELRADDQSELEELGERFQRLVEGVSAAFGVDEKIILTGHATNPRCDPRIVDAVAEAIDATEGLVRRAPVPLGASDDASLMIDRVQEIGGAGTYVAIGAGPYRPHHSPDFDIDERALVPSIELLVRSILRLSALPGRST
jgi:aminobenzoyl-glutamate utilization protein A